MDELAKERYDLAVERIREIREEKTVAEPIWIFYKDSRISGRDDLPAERVETGEMKKLSLGRTAPGKYRVLSGYSAGKLSDLLFKSGLCGKDTGRRSGCTVKLPVYGTSRYDRVCLGTERMGFSGRIGTVFTGV